uniref:Zgc:172145 n=1 Tax=Cynoglossus semilaevis TaxID=244447 RepID=A0A3P8UM07_CYNSE
MAEPATKRLKSSLFVCRAHPSSAVSSRAKHNLPTAVEEALCGVSSLLWDGAYRLQALASVFEKDDAPLPHVAAFFHQEMVKQQAEIESLLHYLTERGGRYCGKDIKRPGCEMIQAVLPALELLQLQLKEEIGALVELSQLALVKGHLLARRVDRLKLLGDLLTSARRVGCTMDQKGAFGEYILNELQEELSH